MANKTIFADLLNFPGETGLTLHLGTQAAPETTLNGSGTACTLVGTSGQSCVVTGTLASYGWLVATYKRGTTRLSKGLVYISGENAGTYIVEDKDAEQRAAQNYAYLPPQTRSVGDVQPLRFLWPVSGATFTGCTKEIGSDSPVSIPSGSFEFLRTVDGDHTYQMLYNAADRPLTEGSVLYRLSDGNNKRKLQLYVTSPTGTNGLHTVTITVRDSTTAVVVGATIVVKNSDESRTIGWGTTNPSGQVPFHLNAGTYKVVVQAPTTQFGTLATQTLVVSAPASVTYTLAVQSLDPPVAPGLCNVRFLVLDRGTPVVGATVTAALDSESETVSTAIISNQPITGTTNGSGYCDLSLIQKSQFTRGGNYSITINQRNSDRVIWSRKVTVPTLSTAYADDLPDA